MAEHSMCHPGRPCRARRPHDRPLSVQAFKFPALLTLKTPEPYRNRCYVLHMNTRGNPAVRVPATLLPELPRSEPDAGARTPSSGSGPPGLLSRGHQSMDWPPV